MFIQYYRYAEKYHTQHIKEDRRIQIAYPTDEHGIMTAAHDFYVIGRFKGVEVAPDARLEVKLVECASGKTVRTVTAQVKDNQRGICASYPGMVTEEPESVIRSCGMPDLVYDPEQPETLWDTWNKAYYTDRYFTALIYGGICQRDRVNRKDQFGAELEPLGEGVYELHVSLDNGDEIISSAKTLRLATGHKEIILSRFSPEAHVDMVEQFAAEEGFEAFTDPYAGIWDTRFFSMDWPVAAYIEIPEKWHFGDAQEYQSGTVYFFNYNISESCISYEVELPSILAGDQGCVDNPRRLLTYYYRNGDPCEGGRFGSGTFDILPPHRYVAVTGKKLEFRDSEWYLSLKAVCKVLSSTVTKHPKGDCYYRIDNRIAGLDYYFCETEHAGPLDDPIRREAGVSDGENLILQVENELPIDPKWYGREVWVRIMALDQDEAVRDTLIFKLDVPVMEGRDPINGKCDSTQ